MLQCTCKPESSSATTDAYDEQALREEGCSSEAAAIDIESASLSENLNGKVADDLSESSAKSREYPSEKKIFSAPPGVIPYHVKWSRIRRKSGNKRRHGVFAIQYRTTGGQRLIFVWPQKAVTRGSYPSSLVPLVRRILVGLVYLGAIHIWPGEFLPTSVPLVSPLPKLPAKCTVIEPLWEEDGVTAIGTT